MTITKDNLHDIEVTMMYTDSASFKNSQAYSARWKSTGKALSETELNVLNNKYLDFAHTSYYRYRKEYKDRMTITEDSLPDIEITEIWSIEDKYPQKRNSIVRSARWKSIDEELTVDEIIALNKEHPDFSFECLLKLWDDKQLTGPSA